MKRLEIESRLSDGNLKLETFLAKVLTECSIVIRGSEEGVNSTNIYSEHD